MPIYLSMWVTRVYGEGATLSLAQQQLITALRGENSRSPSAENNAVGSVARAGSASSVSSVFAADQERVAVVCRLRTGGGKSIAMLYCGEFLNSCTAVVVPTRALCFSLSERCTAANVASLVWRGDKHMSVEKCAHLAEIAVKLKVLIAIPEDCVTPTFCQFVDVLNARRNAVVRVVFDEVHVNWSAFRQKFTAVRELEWLKNTQKVLLSATLSDSRLKEVLSELDINKVQ